MGRIHLFNFCGYNTNTVHIARRSQAATEGTVLVYIYPKNAWLQKARGQSEVKGQKV